MLIGYSPGSETKDRCQLCGAHSVSWSWALLLGIGLLGGQVTLGRKLGNKGRNHSQQGVRDC